MKRFWLSIMAVLLITAVAVPAFAWEFSMTGEFEFRLRYFSRTGTADIWGDASVQETSALNMWESQNALLSAAGAASTAPGPNWNQTVVNAATPSNYIGFAGPNIYLTGYRGAANASRTQIADAAAGAGVIINRGGFSRHGPDALYNDMGMTLHPSFKVNNAIRVHGVYRIGGARQKYVQNNADAYGYPSAGVAPYERYYHAMSSVSAMNTAGIGSWEQMRATIQLPIGILSIGIKDFPFGVGSQFTQNNRSDTWVFILPYGPFRTIYGFYAAEGSTAFNSFVSWASVPDKDTKNDIGQGLLIDYNQGPLNVGVGTLQFTQHFNRAWAQNAAVATILPQPAIAGSLANGANGFDAYWARYLVAAKYNNGRFFLNAEGFWSLRNFYRLGAYPVYREGSAFYADAGVLAGPAKLTLMYAQASGTPQHTRQVAGQGDNLTKWYLNETINYQALRPFQFLMFETYGGGNNTFNADGTGQMGDSMAIAGRLDYAAAANLNLFGTFMYAKRLEQNGVYAGFYNSGLTAAGAAVYATSTSIANAQAWKAMATGQAAATLNPYVDDNLVGWEAQGGFSWKLLEGLTMDAAYSYWQPGPWFNQAYRAVTGAPAGLLGSDMWMTDRSAIQAIRGSFTIDF